MLISFVLLFIIVFLLSVILNRYIKYFYLKHIGVETLKQMDGKSIADAILDKNNIKNVSIVKVAGRLIDNYDYKRRSIKLSGEIFEGRSISAAAIAAHEAAHAVNEKNSRILLSVLSKLQPIVKYSLPLALLFILYGLILIYEPYSYIGLIFYLIVLLFTVILVPFELKTNKIAVENLYIMGVFNEEELISIRKLLLVFSLSYIALPFNILFRVFKFAQLPKK